MVNTIGDILASGKPGSFSNVRISRSIKSKLLRAMKGEKQSSKKVRTTKTKGTQKIKQIIHNAKHKSFVKCVEWAKTCDPIELLEKGVM